MGDYNMYDDMMHDKMECNPGLVIGAQCIIEIEGKFILLVELESKGKLPEFERVLVIEISASTFQELCEKGVKACKVLSKLPKTNGRDLELLCTFIVDHHAFNVFEVEGMCGCDKLIVVKTPICKMCDSKCNKTGK